MSLASILIPSIILPTTGTGTLTVDTTDTYYSITVPVEQLQEKKVQVYGTTVVLPGALSIWIEIAPIDSNAYYTRLAVPLPLATTGSVIIPWTVHSKFVRVGISCASVATGGWVVLAVVTSKSP